MSDKLFNRLAVIWCFTLTISIFCSVIFFPQESLKMTRDDLENLKKNFIELDKETSRIEDQVSTLKIKLDSLVKY